MLIAIEGIDGTGKGTQAKRLCDRLQSDGVKSALLSFPRYDNTLFGSLIGDYLNGRFGTLEQVHPMLAALLFAGDRCESRPVLLDAMREHEIVILDRYVASNIAHQGGRTSLDEREQIIATIERIEFEVYGMPRPDLTILLDLPVSLATELVHRKNPRVYTDQKADLHEADADYMEAVRSVYQTLAATRLNWHLIPVNEESTVRQIDRIEDEIAKIVNDRLSR